MGLRGSTSTGLQVKIGDRIVIKSPDGTVLYMDWTTTAAFTVAAPGGSVPVSGGAPLISPGYSTIQVILFPA